LGKVNKQKFPMLDSLFSFFLQNQPLQQRVLSSSYKPDFSYIFSSSLLQENYHYVDFFLSRRKNYFSDVFSQVLWIGMKFRKWKQARRTQTQKLFQILHSS